MALYHNPKIVTDGLVLYYDKNNTIKSWKGAPTTNDTINPTMSGGGTPGDYAPGWDTALHPNATTCTTWAGGYNSGVGNVDSGYHAQLVYEGQDGGLCQKHIDRNDLYGYDHRWLGISINLGTPASLGWDSGDEITLSWDQKADDTGKGGRCGFYHYRVTEGTQSFEDNISPTLVVAEENVWERRSFTSTITSNWDLTQDVRIYCYGNNGGTNATLWIENVQAEIKGFATPFVDGTRSNTEAIKDLTGRNIITADSLTYTDSDFSFDGSGTTDGLTAGDSIAIPVSVTNTNNYPNGCTYSWWMKVDATNSESRRAILFGAATINHLELISLTGSSPRFRTEARLQNGYSFGTNTIPGGALEGRWVYTNVVFANGESGRPVRWYSNGVLFHTGSMDSGDNPGTEYFEPSEIGRSTGNESYTYSKSFFGEIPSFAINGKALSQAEVRQNFNATRNRFGV